MSVNSRKASRLLSFREDRLMLVNRQITSISNKAERLKIKVSEVEDWSKKSDPAVSIDMHIIVAAWNKDLDLIIVSYEERKELVNVN